ncbi:hypothetical protein [Mycolicibacterium neoaurum]|uniref:hypothetical protein n=1 Tax=Mycolicibacterium neoaurum TaxID=1795 RepID=UPI001F4CA593|nr:hypothetical protein [Mycolicibacterium neoaurum]
MNTAVQQQYPHVVGAPAVAEPRISRLVHAAISVGLFVYHGALAIASAQVVALAINTMRNCTAGLCPTTWWLTPAHVAAVGVLVLLVVIDLVVVVVFLAMNKQAWKVPLAMSGINVGALLLILVLLAQAPRT